MTQARRPVTQARRRGRDPARLAAARLARLAASHAPLGLSRLAGLAGLAGHRESQSVAPEGWDRVRWRRDPSFRSPAAQIPATTITYRDRKGG